MNENIKVIQNPDGTYSLKGLRFGENTSPKSQPIKVNPNRTSSLAKQPDRAFYGEYLDYSQKGSSSVYDDDIVGLNRLEEGYSIDDLRSENQAWYEQIAFGIAKGTVLAGTTFVDGIAGTIAGLLNVGVNISSIYNSDNPLRELGNQFINNPLSTTLADINKNMEEVLPNYYSKEEQEGPWTDHIFTANFIGDKFLKNLGFTIGAAYSGKVVAGVASKAMGLKGVRDAFKGAVTTASGRTLNTSSEIAKAYKTGDAFMDGVKLTDDLGKAAKQLANAEWKLKTIGAVSGAMGEGRIEAINNSRDWFDYNKSLLGFDSTGTLTNNTKNEIAKNVELQLFEEHPEWFSMVPSSVEDGKFTKMLTSSEGQAEWQKRVSDTEKKRYQSLEELSKNRANMANVIFATNTAFLTASNMWQFGRFLSGGYTSGRQFKNLVSGSIKEGFKTNTREANIQLARAVSNPFVEMNEEMTQAFLAETSGLKYAADLNSFYGAKINPEAEEEVSNWLNAIAQGANNTYGNFDTWEEGALGFMTGVLGIPKVGLRRNNQGRLSGLSFTSEGEFWQGIKDYRSTKKESVEVADALNKRVQSEDFKNYYQGIIRHTKYGNDMAVALDRGDHFDYKNAEHSQLVSDAILFDKAGRIQDLYDIIKEGSNVSSADIDDIRSLSIDKNSGKSIYEGKTDDEIISHVKKQAEEAKKKVDSFVQISNDLKTLYGDNISSDHLEELTWMMTQVNDWEYRTKSLVRNVQETLNKKAAILEDRFGIEVNTTLRNLEHIVGNLSEEDNIIDQINSIIEDKNVSVEEGRARIESLIRDKEYTRNTSGLKLGNEIAHIRKKARLRREELQKQYSKLSSDLVENDSKAREESKRAYKTELENLTKEMYDIYTENSHYADLKLDDLRVQAVEAFERYEEQTKNSAEAFKLAEDYLYRQVILPLTTLEGSRGRSTWEKNRETEARLRQKETSKSLFSQIVALKDLLNSKDYQSIDPLNVQKLSEDLIDLIKLYVARRKFISKYTQLAENPELFTKEAQEGAERIINNVLNKEAEKILSKITDKTTVKELRKILSTASEDIQSKVIARLKESSDKNLKILATNYEELEDSRNIIADIINGRNRTPESISAFNIINDAFNNSDNLEEAKLIVAEGIANVAKPISDEIISIMDLYVEHMNSKESTKKDKNKAKKKLKKKKGLLDIATDEEGVPDAEMLEGIQEKEKKTKKKTEESEDEEKSESEDSIDTSIKKAAKEDLEDLVSGKTTISAVEVNEKDAKAVKEIAKRELERRENPPVHTEDNDSSDGNSEVNTTTPRDTLAGYLRSWAVTQYNFNDLKNRDTRRAVPYKDPRVSKLIELGAFEFVDSGRLGDLFNANNNIPIHYITVSTGPLKGTVLLAIEVKDKVVPINVITAQDNKQYQVVGTLGFNMDNNQSLRAYNQIVDYIKDERGTSTAKYFVSDMTNKIRHIYSGRMVKSTETETVQQRPLKNILNGEKPHFGVYYKEGDFRTPTLGEEDEVVSLNQNNGNPREGSLWIMTKEADGRYYAKAVKVSRFNSSYDLKANMESPIIQRLIEDIRDIVDPAKSDYQKSLAKYDIEELLYFPEGTSLLFKNTGEEVIISISDYENNIGEGLDLEDKVEAILEALHSDTLDLRFQVSTPKLNKEGYVEDLLNSDILTTDILKLHNVNASFDMYLPNLETGKPLEDKKPSTGHIGRRGINSEISGDTIIHNGQTYRLTNDGVYKDGTKITDQNTIDEVIFISKIKAGVVNPVEGNNRLYVGAYSNGEKFGVVNYRIKTGEELEELLEKAKKVEKKTNMEDFRNTWETVSNKESQLPYDVYMAEAGISQEKIPFFEAASAEDYYSAIGEKEEQKTKPSILEIASLREDKEEELSKKGPQLNAQFNNTSTRSIDELKDSSESFENFIRKKENRGVIRELGFNSIKEMIEFITNPLNELPNISTITDQESFDALIETIKRCR